MYAIRSYYGLLHFKAQLGDRMIAGRVAETVEAGEVAVGGASRQFRLGRAGNRGFAAAQAGCAAEHDEVDQRVGAEAVGAVDRHAGRFANSHKARHDRIRIA